MLQWFSLNLLSRKLVPPGGEDGGGGGFSPRRTAAVLDVGPQDLEVVMAVPSGGSQPFPRRLAAVSRLSAFGRSVKLVSLVFRGMGLMPARLAVLTAAGVNSTEAASNSTTAPDSDVPLLEVRSECMNPIAEAVWAHEGREYHVRGKETPGKEATSHKLFVIPKNYSFF